jgi:hypothetical protein
MNAMKIGFERNFLLSSIRLAYSTVIKFIALFLLLLLCRRRRRFMYTQYHVYNKLE